MSEVTELAPGDIQRTGGVSAGGQAQPQSVQESNAAPAEMGPEQRAALERVADLRGRVLDRSLTDEQRQFTMARISELQRFAFGGEKPAWLNPKADPRATSLETYDALAEGLAAGYEPMNAEQAGLVRHSATLWGLPPEATDNFMKLAEQAQLPHGHAKDIVGRLARHFKAMEGNVELEADDHAEFEGEAVRSFGSEEKYQQVAERARAYLRSVGMLEYVDREFANTSVVYDPRILLSLANLATARGVK